MHAGEYNASKPRMFLMSAGSTQKKISFPRKQTIFHELLRIFQESTPFVH